MKIFRNFIKRWTALRRPDAMHREIDEELDFHLDLKAAEFRRRGMTDSAALLAARKTFGQHRQFELMLGCHGAI